MAEHAARSGSASAGSGTGAGGSPVVPMHHGGGGPSSPRAAFVDPMAWGWRAPGVPCVRPEDAAAVVCACRQGRGGPTAWTMTSHPGAPLSWMHAGFVDTVRWRVREEAAEAFLVDAMWIAAIPNYRLADLLRANVFAEARDAAWRWTAHDVEAWTAAEVDDLEVAPSPFAWPGEACLGGPAEGDGGLPIGLILRANSVSWRVLAASRWRAFIRAQWEVPMYGGMAEEMSKGVRLRRQVDEVRARKNDDELMWIRQPGDGEFYGNRQCPHCEQDGRCLRCLFCFHRFCSNGFYFDLPKPDSSSRKEREDDVRSLMNLGILPWGSGQV